MEWLKHNAVPFQSIEPHDTDFSDLLALKQIIGDARVVQLGEPSHGDGECFLAKVRLVKFLHQELGFDVLAMESGIFDCNEAWKDFQAATSPLPAAKRGVFGIWTGSRQTASLWDYISEKATSNHALELIGFDCQFTATASRETLVTKILELTKRVSLSLETSTVDAFVRNMQLAIEGQSAKCNWESVFAILQPLHDELNRADHGLNEIERAYWIQVLQSTIEQCNQTQNPSSMGNATQVNRRDTQMAQNLLWYLRTHPSRKVIVWAASFHITRHLDEVRPVEPSLNYKGTITMGQIVHEALNRDCFTIGFTAYEGKAGAWFRKPGELEPAPMGTLESECQEAGLVNALIPLRDLPGNHWLMQKVLCRPLGYSWMDACWPRHFDAMIFQRTMTPSTTR